jgi:uncharacterized protein (DUF885 family)
MTQRPPSTPAVLLADEFVRHRSETDHAWALWTGDMSHLERWNDLSDDGLAHLATQLDEFAQRAEAIEPIDDTDRLLLETVGYTAKARSLSAVWQPELGWVNHVTGILPSIFTFLPRYPLVTQEHGERYLAKIAGLPTFLDQWCDRLRIAASERRAPIVHLVDSVVGVLDTHLSAPLSAGPLGRQAPPTELDAGRGAGWTSRLHGMLDDAVGAAFGRLRDAVGDVIRPVARPDNRPGLVHVPGGAALYEELIWAHTTQDLAAIDVHEIGLQRVHRLEQEYLDVAAPLLGTDDLADIYRRLRDDPDLHYRDADTIVRDATAALDKASAVMRDWFATLPQAACVASAIEQGALAFYSPPARDGSKPGTFFFNTTDPTAWGTYQLEAVTYHESIPGHHLQFAIAQELPDLHPLLGRFYITAYGEGWGLYTERLADEMGLYSGPIDRIGMLAADSMRACRLVVDTGMHALGWSRDEAITYMYDHAPLSVPQVVGEIDRYIGNPGQAVSYMIGRMEIDRLRDEARARLGERFDVRGFHDVVLGSGSITLPSLRRLVEAWDGARRSATP